MPVDCTVREHAVETMRRSHNTCHNTCKVTETSNSNKQRVKKHVRDIAVFFFSSKEATSIMAKKDDLAYF